MSNLQRFVQDNKKFQEGRLQENKNRFGRFSNIWSVQGMLQFRMGRIFVTNAEYSVTKK